MKTSFNEVVAPVGALPLDDVTVRPEPAVRRWRGGGGRAHDSSFGSCHNGSSVAGAPQLPGGRLRGDAAGAGGERVGAGRCGRCGRRVPAWRWRRLGGISIRAASSWSDRPVGIWVDSAARPGSTAGAVPADGADPQQAR